MPDPATITRTERVLSRDHYTSGPCRRCESPTRVRLMVEVTTELYPGRTAEWVEEHIHCRFCFLQISLTGPASTGYEEVKARHAATTSAS